MIRALFTHFVTPLVKCDLGHRGLSSKGKYTELPLEINDYLSYRPCLKFSPCCIKK